MKIVVRMGLLMAAVGTLVGCGNAMSGLFGGRGGETWNAATAVQTFQLGLQRGMSAGAGVATQQGGNAERLDGAVTVGDHVVTFHLLQVTAQPYALTGSATISGANAAEISFAGGSANGSVTVNGATSTFAAAMPPSFLIAAVTGEYVMHTLDVIQDIEMGVSCSTSLAPTLNVSTTDGGMDISIDGSGFGLTFTNVTLSDGWPESVTGTIVFAAGTPDAITFVFSGDTVAISMGGAPIATVDVDDLECDLAFVQTDVWELLWTAQTLATDTSGSVAASLCPNVTITAGSGGSYTLDGSCDFPEPGTSFSQLTIVPATLPVGTVGTAQIGDYPQLTLGFDGTTVNVQACDDSIAVVQLNAL